MWVRPFVSPGIKHMANDRNADINAQAVSDDKAASLVAKPTDSHYGRPRTSKCPATDNRIPRAVTVSLPIPNFLHNVSIRGRLTTELPLLHSTLPRGGIRKRESDSNYSASRR